MFRVFRWIVDIKTLTTKVSQEIVVMTSEYLIRTKKEGWQLKGIYPNY